VAFAGRRMGKELQARCEVDRSLVIME
jgi:hypothetical protein